MSTSQRERNYLSLIGKNVPETITPSKSPETRTLPVVNASNKKGSNNKENRPQNRKRKNACPDSPPQLGPYEESVLRRREENLAMLQSLQIGIPTPKVQKRPKPAKKKKENNTQGERRIMPSRKSKTNASLRLDQGEDSEEIDGEDVDQVPGAGDAPLSTESVSDQPPEEKPVLRWSSKQEANTYNGEINKFTPLSPFPKKLLASLKRGVYDTKLMNDFLLEHSKTITGRLPQRGEYAVLADQVVKRLKDELMVENADTYREYIRLHLSGAKRTRCYMENKGKERRRARRLAAREVATLQFQENAGNDSNQEVGDDSDNLLRRPVAKIETVKMALSSSTTRVQFIQTHSVQESLDAYPYLRNPDLVIYDYSTRVPILLKDAEMNFQQILKPLAHILNKDEPSSELDKVVLFQAVENFFTCDEDPVRPSLVLWDTSVKQIAPLNDIPAGQAPTLVVLKTLTEIMSASVSFDGQIISTASKPSGFECLALLLGTYYVFNVAYPKAYCNHLLVIEAILHNDLDNALKASISSRTRVEFLRKLITANLASKQV